MLWTWPRLRSMVTSLELPTGQYAVGLAGAMLANESIECTDEVVLLAADEVHDELAREGWLRRPGGAGLSCPSEPGLVVRAGDVSDSYVVPIPQLLADAWHQDGVPVVSVLQIARSAVQDFLARATAVPGPTPATLTWRWSRLRDAVAALELPLDEYVVGLNGALLANESVPAVDEVELLVTTRLVDELVERGWIRGADGRLACPVEDNLVARADDLDDTYLLGVPELAADAWSRDGIPLVSMVRVRREAVQAVLG